jgi:anaerobic magnesium-protoporphyrin IX monomethyl ester cyclase
VIPVSLIIASSGFLLDERVFMSLGILKVAAALEAAGHPVDVLDLSGVADCDAVVRSYARQSQARHFGITATTPQLPVAVMIAKAIRAVRPDARIILGGPHVTLVNAAVKRHPHGRAAKALKGLHETFDVLVAGDGEAAIFLALADCPPPLIDADVPASILFLTNAKLTAQQLPARHLVDVDSYHYEIEGRRALSLIAQLGCPFGCGFCGGRSSPSLRRVRTRTTDSIVAEMVTLYETYGTTGFMFYDDELNVNREMVPMMRAIRAAQDRLGVDWRLRGFVKAELLTDEQASELYAAGFRSLLIGFESGSPRILDNIQKKATRDDNSRALAIARDHGLKVKALMSIGHPGETPETVQATQDWLLAERPDDFDVSIITTYPGTPYYDDAVQTGSDVWTYTAASGDRLHGIDVDFSTVSEYYKGAPGHYRAYVFTDAMTSGHLVTMRDALEREVRARLSIPYPVGAARTFEHSMGQVA